MPTGKAWPDELVAGIASNMMEKDGWTPKRLNMYSKSEQEKLLKKYLRKAGEGLHACHQLGLITTE